VIALIAALIFINGFFVAAEFALVRLQAAHTHRWTDARGLRGRILKNILRDLDPYLTTAQIGITSTSIALGSIGEPWVAGVLSAALGDWLPNVDALSPGVSFALSLGVITVIQIIIGEQAPKSYGIKSYEAVAGWTAVPLQVVYIVCWPLVRTINFFSLVVVRLLGADIRGGDTLRISEEELRVLLMHSHRGGSISDRERRIMVNAMRLADQEATDVMVPRPDVVTIDAEESLVVARKVAIDTGHSRIPVVDPDLDHCVGVLYAKDLLQEPPDSTKAVANLVRPAIHVPETISLERLLYLFQSRGLHIALLVDEFGGASGIVTLENVLEALVGDIHDEYDRGPSLTPRKLAEDRWRVPGMAKVETVEQLIGLTLDTEQDTISGWFIDHKDGFPRRGDLLEVDGWRFVVESLDKRRIASLFIEKVPERLEDDED
jgi:CBS domain containing-hemolysin-like protein